MKSSLYRNFSDTIGKSYKILTTFDNIFSVKARWHLTDEDYFFIETSLLIFCHFDSLKNDSLDYSGVIISLLKCLERILF